MSDQVDAFRLVALGRPADLSIPEVRASVRRSIDFLAGSARRPSFLGRVRSSPLTRSFLADRWAREDLDRQLARFGR